MPRASQGKRSIASELVIGMKCGGSDGLSGITANPTVGAFSDLLVSKGGTTILTEVPEMFGAETILMNRCATPELFDKTVDLINDFKIILPAITRPFTRILLRETRRAEFPPWRISPWLHPEVRQLPGKRGAGVC